MAVGNKLRALQIKANLIADETVGLMEIDTDVDDGVAILTGEVETEEQKRVAEELAYEAEGIHEVRNEIRVVYQLAALKPEPMEGIHPHLGYGLAEGSAGNMPFALSGDYTTPGPGFPASEQFPGEFTDEEVVNEVKEKLANQHYVEALNIEVSSINQIVHLKGQVKTSAALNSLTDIVLNVRGVMGVDSAVSIEEGEIGTPIE